MVSLIGANGAGKTTTLRTISGLLHAASRRNLVRRRAHRRTPAHQIVTRGLAHSPEGRRIFPG